MPLHAKASPSTSTSGTVQRTCSLHISICEKTVDYRRNESLFIIDKIRVDEGFALEVQEMWV